MYWKWQLTCNRDALNFKEDHGMKSKGITWLNLFQLTSHLKIKKSHLQPIHIEHKMLSRVESYIWTKGQNYFRVDGKCVWTLKVWSNCNNSVGISTNQNQACNHFAFLCYLQCKVHCIYSVCQICHEIAILSDTWNDVTFWHDLWTFRCDLVWSWMTPVHRCRSMYILSWFFTGVNSLCCDRLEVARKINPRPSRLGRTGPAI